MRNTSGCHQGVYEYIIQCSRDAVIHESAAQTQNQICCEVKNQLLTDLGLFLTSCCDNIKFKTLSNIQTCQTVKTIRGPNGEAGKIMSRSGFRASILYKYRQRKTGRLEDRGSVSDVSHPLTSSILNKT